MLPTGTVTFLFTDIQGSTPLWETQPEQMAQALQVHNTTLRGAIESYGGVIFKTVGDAFQSSFPTAPQALKAAIESQKALASAPWNELGELKVRMGLHTGEAELDPGGDEYAVSHSKNRVARIMSAASGGQVLLSQETADLVDHQLPEGVTLKDLGEHRLKGMQWLEHLYQVCVPRLPVEFPPLATSVTYPHNLPLQLTSFVGREQEIEAVCALLSSHRLVTLTGSGGTGKTRLSLQVAEEMLDRFPQGIWFTELAGLNDPDLVPRTLLAVFGLPESSTIALIDQLKSYLKDKQLLIVLDNCEHVIADCARIAEVLLRSCPGLKILASSREALSVPGEFAYHVLSLAIPDPRQLPPFEELAQFTAVQLFAERAAAVSPGFTVTPANAAAVAQICRRLDGIPLAIELAAARVGSLSVEQIASRLDNRFRLLTGGSRTAVPRQQTLRASIDWSYSLLKDCERLLLMRLSVFHGGWTLEQAVEVCALDGLDEFEVLDGLGQLVQKSLIFTVSSVDGENRYRRLETIRQYAREKLLDSGGSEAVYDRHLDAFLMLAVEAEPHLRSHRQVEWMDRLELELDNLRAALEWSLEGESQKGLRLATFLYWFWHIRGYRLESERWLARLVERVRSNPEPDPVLISEALGRQALLLCATGQVGESTAAIAAQALEMAKQQGVAGLHQQFYALHALAWNAGYLYQRHISYDLNLQSLQVAEALGDRFLLAEAYQNLSYLEPDPDQAQKYSEMNLTLRQELGDLDGMATAEALLGGFFYSQGELSQACLHYEQSIQLAHQIQNPVGSLTSYGAIGRVFYAQGEFDQAIQHFEKALEFVREVGEQTLVIWLSNALVYAFGARKEWLQAARYFEQAVQIAREIGGVYWEIMLNINLAEVAYSLDKEKLAVQHYQAAAEIARQHPEIPVSWQLAYSAGKAALLSGDLASAGDFLRQALADVAAQNNRDAVGGCLGCLAVCALQAGQFERAARLHGIVAGRRWLADPVMPLWMVPYDLDSILTPTRLALGESEYARLYAEGQAMPLEQALDFATAGS